MKLRHDKYDENLKEAQLFEDHACQKLYEAGMVVVPYRSRSWQSRYGESRAGVEIKYDKNRNKTGNLFIEIEEKWGEEAEWKPSGIFGKGVFLCIGDYHKIWLIGFNVLKRVYATDAHKDVATKTARGFLLPVALADKVAEWTDPPRES
jgi:hypothetical protein